MNHVPRLPKRGESLTFASGCLGIIILSILLGLAAALWRFTIFGLF